MSISSDKLQCAALPPIRCLILLCLCTSFYSVPVSAQSLQRLFSTPEQRIALDRKRQNGEGGSTSQGIISIAEVPNNGRLGDPPASAIQFDAKIDLIALGGSVRSSDGSYTVWVNGQPYNQYNLPKNMQLLEPFQQGQLKIYNSEKNLYYHLKPGQILDLVNGEVLEVFNTATPENPSPDLALPDATVVTPEIGQSLDGERDDQAS